MSTATIAGSGRLRPAPMDPSALRWQSRASAKSGTNTAQAMAFSLEQQLANNSNPEHESHKILPALAL